MATQEPNVYAGLSVVIGGLMHARPRFFAKVMGELLFWVGEDKMTFGSDYGIWEPEVAGRGLRRLGLPRRRRVLRLPAGHDGDQEEDPRPERGQALRHRGARRVPAAGRRAATPAAQDDATAGGRRRQGRRRDPGPRRRVLAALDTVRDPELDEPVTALGFVASCTVSADGVAHGPAAAADLLLRAELRLPDGRRRLRRGVGVPGRRAGPRWCWTTTSPPTRSTAAWPPGPASSASFDGLGGRRARRAAAPTSCARRCWPAPTGCAGRCWPRGGRREELAALTLGDVPPAPDLERLRSRRAELGPAGRRRRRRCWSTR